MFGLQGSAGTVALPSGTTYANVMIFNNPNQSYSLAAPSGGTLAMTPIDLAGNNKGSGIIEVVSGTHSIAAPVNLLSTTNITMYDPTAQLTFGGNISGSGAMTLAGSGELILTGNNNTFSGGLDVQGGILEVQQPGGLMDGLNITIGDPSLFGGSFSPITPASSTEGTNFSAVPEPGSVAIIAVSGGFVWMLGRSRRRRAARKG
jgi:autotransporter-associated beta strand protein